MIPVGDGSGLQAGQFSTPAVLLQEYVAWNTIWYRVKISKAFSGNNIIWLPGCWPKMHVDSLALMVPSH